MSRESIQKIKETEQEAERIVSEAQARAQQMIADAERNGQALCERTEAETVAAAKDVMLQLQERSNALRTRMSEEAQEEANELKRQASLRRRSAEKIVIRGLTSKCR